MSPKANVRKLEENASPLHSNSIPYYLQIVSLLKRKVEHGELLPGSKLASEPELARSFGVSRITIRQALAVLEANGLVRRQRGLGTFVSESLVAPKPFRLTGHIEDFVRQGMVGKVRFLSDQIVQAPPFAADFFGIQTGENVAQIQRLRMMEDTPVYFNTHYIRQEMFERIPRGELNTQTMLNIFKNRMNISLGKIYQTIEARTADTEIAGHLAIEVMAPVMYVETFVYEDNGKPLKFSQIFCPGDRFKYSTEFFKEKEKP